MLLWTLITGALGGEVEAEALRLVQDIDTLARRTAWTGVDRKYAGLLDLKDVEIPARTHLLAAHAAQDRGDIEAASRRANRAIRAPGSDEATLQEASEWMADLLVNYGEVRIELSVAFKGPVRIEPDEPLFAPGKRAVLAHAEEVLQTERSFTGYLPLARYRIGHTRFDIYGGPAVKVFVKPVKGVGVARAPADLGERTVVLGARGGGWRADQWGALARKARDAMYGIEGVQSIDLVEPDSPWVSCSPVLPALSGKGLTVVDLADALRSAGHAPIFSTEHLAVPPGSDPSAIGAVPVGEDRFEALCPLTTETPSLPVEPDAGAKPVYGLQVRMRGDPEALVRAAAMAGAGALGLTPETPASE